MPVSLLKQCSDEEFATIVQNSFSVKEIQQKLGYNSLSGSVATNIRKRIAELNLNTEHFTTRKPVERTIENVFIENSTASQRVLRDWYKKGEYAPYVCSICGQEPMWKDKPLTLILDHINGYNKDDRLENLRWVCPNCNQQLDTFGSRNAAYKKTKKYCPDCGKEITSKATRCASCAGKFRAEELPVTREELKQLIRNMPFTQIGNKFYVSDNAIRKWCDKYNLPRKVSDIKQFTDKEWQDI